MQTLLWRDESGRTAKLIDVKGEASPFTRAIFFAMDALFGYGFQSYGVFQRFEVLDGCLVKADTDL